jgi:hypothetical protein
MTDAQKLVHLAHRYDPVDIEQRRVQLLQTAKRAYEDELTLMAARVGCPGRRGYVGEGPILSMLNGACTEWAAGIANTYNYDVAVQIVAIGIETPTANRHVYTKRLREWHTSHQAWKEPQIEEYTNNWARARAQEDFRQYNGTMGTAELMPKEAVCPVCVAMVARGKMPLREALNDSPPYHANCPHFWSVSADRVPREECPLLWMGE